MNLDLFDGIYPEQQAVPFKLPMGPNYSYLWDQDKSAYVISIPDGELIYYDNFFGKKLCDRTIEYFLENETKDVSLADRNNITPADIQWRNIHWQQDCVSIYGKSILQPRFSAWHGDSDKPYSYSGLTLAPKPWNKGLAYIKQKIEEATSFSFNSVLLNWYRDGNDHISWHTDAETELGKNPVIGSVSFGETRRFLLRRMDNHNEKIELALNSGSLLIMHGPLQHFWQHSIPKQKAVTKLRFNLTFRNIKSPNIK